MPSEDRATEVPTDRNRPFGEAEQLSSARRLAAIPAIGALLLLSHPPAQAGMIVLPGAICGASRGDDVPIPVRKSAPDDEDRGCLSACHAARAPRRCDRIAA